METIAEGIHLLVADFASARATADMGSDTGPARGL